MPLFFAFAGIAALTGLCGFILTVGIGFGPLFDPLTATNVIATVLLAVGTCVITWFGQETNPPRVHAQLFLHGVFLIVAGGGVLIGTAFPNSALVYLFAAWIAPAFTAFVAQEWIEGAYLDDCPEGRGTLASGSFAVGLIGYIHMLLALPHGDLYACARLGVPWIMISVLLGWLSLHNWEKHRSKDRVSL